VVSKDPLLGPSAMSVLESLAKRMTVAAHAG
jgi:hypothetical protein